MRLTVAVIDQAIDTIVDSRQTHEHWAAARRGGDQALLDEIGDEAFHRQCVDDYTHVLDVLHEIRRRRR